jgi:hypothetical protein
MPSTVSRSLSVDNQINVTGVILASGIGLVALIVGFASYKLQRYLHRRTHPRYELDGGYELHTGMQP